MQQPCTLTQGMLSKEAMYLYLCALTSWAGVCAAPTTATSKTDAVALYPASASNPTINPPLKFKTITYTTSGTTSTATLT